MPPVSDLKNKQCNKIYLRVYKDWLNNEYSQWVKALQSSTVDNFDEHPMVKRMLGEVREWDYWPFIKVLSVDEIMKVNAIMCIGGNFSSIVTRMIFYAQKVLAAKPKFIVEIGGGVGQFYAVLRALGYKGGYYIYDLPEVQEFQRKYLDRVTELTGLDTSLSFPVHQYCVSMYALGEFDDETKAWYVENVVKECEHGLVVFNPHSGASDTIDWDCTIEDEYPLTSPNNKLLYW